MCYGLHLGKEGYIEVQVINVMLGKQRLKKKEGDVRRNTVSLVLTWQASDVGKMFLRRNHDNSTKR